ncbi:unnamed protein product [Prorocentrum cordatum]|uniref:Uncharacterized protein n=1 Tax=Prorocentrum cordatum TaxID=2364126 RepID=A0ABN9U4U9_9DINO|nr:unnamed protein product [Polarella glacialis]
MWLDDVEAGDYARFDIVAQAPAVPKAAVCSGSGHGSALAARTSGAREAAFQLLELRGDADRGAAQAAFRRPAHRHRTDQHTASLPEAAVRRAKPGALVEPRRPGPPPLRAASPIASELSQVISPKSRPTAVPLRGVSATAAPPEGAARFAARPPLARDAGGGPVPALAAEAPPPKALAVAAAPPGPSLEGLGQAPTRAHRSVGPGQPRQAGSTTQGSARTAENATWKSRADLSRPRRRRSEGSGAKPIGLDPEAALRGPIPCEARWNGGAGSRAFDERAVARSWICTRLSPGPTQLPPRLPFWPAAGTPLILQLTARAAWFIPLGSAEAGPSLLAAARSAADEAVSTIAVVSAARARDAAALLNQHWLDAEAGPATGERAAALRAAADSARAIARLSGERQRCAGATSDGTRVASTPTGARPVPSDPSEARDGHHSRAAKVRGDAIADVPGPVDGGDRPQRDKAGPWRRVPIPRADAADIPGPVNGGDWPRREEAGLLVVPLPRASPREAAKKLSNVVVGNGRPEDPPGAGGGVSEVPRCAKLQRQRQLERKIVEKHADDYEFGDITKSIGQALFGNKQTKKDK